MGRGGRGRGMRGHRGGTDGGGHTFRGMGRSAGGPAKVHLTDNTSGMCQLIIFCLQFFYLGNFWFKK